MKELNIIKVRHETGREIQFIQFDKLAIGQILERGEDPKLHYAFQTHLETKTEYIKLDELLRELGFEEIERTPVPNELDEDFNELHFTVQDIGSYWGYAYEFANLTIVASHDGVFAFGGPDIDDALSRHLDERYVFFKDETIDIPNDEAAELAFRYTNFEYKYFHWLRGPGEMYDNDDHLTRLSEVMDTHDSLPEGMAESINDHLEESRSFSELQADAELYEAIVREGEALQADYMQMAMEQTEQSAPELEGL